MIDGPHIGKATPGITASSSSIAHIGRRDCDLDVDSGPPPAVYGGKGPAVRRVTSYVSWVQNAAKQFG